VELADAWSTEKDADAKAEECAQAIHDANKETGAGTTTNLKETNSFAR